MSEQREDFTRFRYGVPVDDPDVQEAMATLLAMPAAAQAELLRSVLCAHVALQRGGGTGLLLVAALDVAATFRAHRNPMVVLREQGAVL